MNAPPEPMVSGKYFRGVGELWFRKRMPAAAVISTKCTSASTGLGKVRGRPAAVGRQPAAPSNASAASHRTGVLRQPGFRLFETAKTRKVLVSGKSPRPAG